MVGRGWNVGRKLPRVPCTVGVSPALQGHHHLAAPLPAVASATLLPPALQVGRVAMMVGSR